MFSDDLLALQTFCREKLRDAMKKLKCAKFAEHTVETEEVNEFFEVQKNFESLIPSIMLFIEHEPYTNVAMNLDTNFRRVLQQNYKKPKNGLTMEQSIHAPKGNTFNNSSIELLFYKKLNNTSNSQLTKEEKDRMPKIFSMSKCWLDQEIELNIEGLNDDLELSFEYEDASAQYVTVEEYQQLLFLMGLRWPDSEGTHQDYKLILSIFKLFDLGTEESFKNMLEQLDFPYEYNENKTLPQNRQEFKSFFSCLTNIRCAVVEGGHRIEAACRTLQGYKLGDPLPLKFDKSLFVPASSTLFKPIPTRVFYYRLEEGWVIQDHLKSLQQISEDIANKKEYYLEKDWKWWWTELSQAICGHEDLNGILFPTQDEFYEEDLNFREVGSEQNVTTVQVRLILHKILTCFIFDVQPCKNLLQLVTKKKKPTAEVWTQLTEKWCHFTADPYHLVSPFPFFVPL